MTPQERAVQIAKDNVGLEVQNQEIIDLVADAIQSAFDEGDRQCERMRIALVTIRNIVSSRSGLVDRDILDIVEAALGQ